MCGLKENLRRKRRKNVSPFNFFISLQSRLVIVYSKEKFEIHRVSITISNGRYKNCRFCVVTKAKAFYLREQLTFALVVPPLQS